MSGEVPTPGSTSNVSASSSTPDAAAPTASSSSAKRKRLHGACDACRKKKTKCDSALKPDNICTNCINCRIHCTHESSRRKKHDAPVPPTSSHLQALEDRLKSMEAYLRSVGHQPIVPTPGASNEPARFQPILPRPSPTATTPPTTTPFASNASDFHLESDLHKPPAVSPLGINPTAGTLWPNDETDISDPDDLVHATLSERLKNLSVDITENRFFGRSSMFLYAQNCMEFKNERAGTMDGNFARTKRPVYWQLREWERDYLQSKDAQYTFPPPDLLDTLMSLYFNNVHPFLPVLHRPTFEREVKMQLHYHDQSFAATVLLVCAIASRFSTDPRVYLQDNDDSSAGWKYVSQLPITSSISMVHTNLYDLQRYALASIYFQGSSMNHTSWNLAGLGLRLAQDSGLHRRQRSQYKPTKDSELKRRAFWVLVAMDRTMSSLLGRSCALYSEDIDVDFPLECDDEYWETGDPKTAFKQPPSKPSFMVAFTSYLRLCDIIGSMLRTLYSTKKCRIIHGLIGDNWENRIVTELDTSLVAWKQALSRHLSWDPDTTNRIFFNQSMFLHCMFSYVRIQIHRPLLRGDATMSASYTLCREEAKNCSQILTVVNRRGGATNPGVMMAAFASSLTMVIDLWAKREFVTPEEVASYNKKIENCLLYIRRGENRWHGAARMIDMITEFRSVRSPNVQMDSDGISRSSSGTTYATAYVPSPSSVSSSSGSLEEYSNRGGSSSAPAFSTPSPPVSMAQAQSQVAPENAVRIPPTRPLSMTDLPEDTPFNFDFTGIQPGSGSFPLSFQVGYHKPTFPYPSTNSNNGGVQGVGLLPSTGVCQSYVGHNPDPDPLSASLWSDAPFSYSVQEWSNYIANLDRIPQQ